MFNIVFATLSLQASHATLFDLDSDLNDLSTMTEPAVHLTPNLLQEGGTDNVYKKPELSVLVQCGGTDDEPFYGSRIKVLKGYTCCDAENDVWTEKDQDCPGPKAEVNPLFDRCGGKDADPLFNEASAFSKAWQKADDENCEKDSFSDKKCAQPYQAYAKAKNKAFKQLCDKAGANRRNCQNCNQALTFAAEPVARYYHGLSNTLANHPLLFDKLFGGNMDSGTFCKAFKQRAPMCKVYMDATGFKFSDLDLE